MRFLLASALSLGLFSTAAMAGSFFGPPPFSGGAYYDGQFDGQYSANIYSDEALAVVFGVVGFSINRGAPSTIVAGGGNIPVVDPTRNYYLIFVNGQAFRGEAVGSININTKNVTGMMAQSEELTDAAGNTIVMTGGYFSAAIGGWKSKFTFSGTGQLDGNQPFFIDGIKTAEPSSGVN
jgi:hypothetical protein